MSLKKLVFKDVRITNPPPPISMIAALILTPVERTRSRDCRAVLKPTFSPLGCVHILPMRLSFDAVHRFYPGFLAVTFQELEFIITPFGP